MKIKNLMIIGGLAFALTKILKISKLQVAQNLTEVNSIKPISPSINATEIKNSTADAQEAQILADQYFLKGTKYEGLTFAKLPDFMQKFIYSFYWDDETYRKAITPDEFYDQPGVISEDDGKILTWKFRKVPISNAQNSGAAGFEGKDFGPKPDLKFMSDTSPLITFIQGGKWVCTDYTKQDTCVWQNVGEPYKAYIF